MITLINLVLVYIAFLIVVLAHELAHFPNKWDIHFGLFNFPQTGGVRIRLLFLPEGSSMAAKFQLGGLVMNFVIIYLVYHFKPENLLLQLMGLVSYFHFVLYTFFGSFNPELSERTIRKYPFVLDFWVFDDVKNDYAFVFVPISIFTLIYFWHFYIPILSHLLG